MTKNKFGEYVFNRQVNEFGELCAELGVDLAPFSEIVTHYCVTEDMDSQDVRDELVGLFEAGIMQGIGNMAGSAWGAVKNGFNNFNQGFQNGQQNQQGAANPAAQQNGMTQNGNISGKQLFQQIQQANAMFQQIQQSTSQVGNMLKQMMGTMSKLKNTAAPVA